MAFDCTATRVACFYVLAGKSFIWSGRFEKRFQVLYNKLLKDLQDVCELSQFIIQEIYFILQGIGIEIHRKVITVFFSCYKP